MGARLRPQSQNSILKAEKGVSKEDAVRPYLQRMERRNRHGVYCIFTSMEMGSTFTSKMPKFPTEDPHYRIIRRVPSRSLHYYFYIRDPEIGPLAMCVGTYLPFQTTYSLNGHNFIEIQLRRQGVAFRKDDNAFLSTSDPKALQAAADQLSAATLEKRLTYWSWLFCPKFSEKDRQAVPLDRQYSINQIEYCRNFVFKRHFPIHKIFAHSCEMGLFCLAADKVAYIFGVRIAKRLRGKLYSVLEKLDHGHHVLRIYGKNPVGRRYEKFNTFLRVEVCVNRRKDLGLNKGWRTWSACAKSSSPFRTDSPASKPNPSTCTSTFPCCNGWLCRRWPAKPKSPASRSTIPG
jgi:hypothetical protein